jgi:hypothetical protein
VFTFATHVTFGGYNRSRGVEATYNRKLGAWHLQTYWTNGAGGRKYDKPDGRTFKTKREALEAKRVATSCRGGRMTP